MRDWITTTIGEFIDFNPSEKLQKNKIAKKIPMDKLGTFERKIKGFVFTEYQSGPKFRNNDTLVAKITPCLENGKTAFVNILDNEEVAFGSSEFIVLRNNKLSDAKFIYYLARSPYFREKAISCMEGTSGRKRVNETALKHLNIKVPPIETQQKIAKILSDIDDKIEILHQINDNLAELAKTIYDYWFVQFDFPDENGKPYKTSGGKMVYNEVLKREIPEGWEAEKLKKYAFIKKGTLITEKQANTNGNIKVVSAGLDFSYYHDKSNFLENTITISASGANAGFINFWREPIFACDCTTVRGNNLTETLYIYQFLKILQDYIYQQAKGSAQPHIYPKDIEDLNIIIPNENEIKKYGEYVNDLNQKILLNLKEIQHLQSLRDWLLPMLMNGQISVE